ncbi:MarR family winged helix-turn-helix transcriptional regulator [Micromonospora endolithica]|uniref:MarR family transcriptional regulator n=1 Tax=Micromonospora endolithica TaxID=230091 RepID=A0A3A9YQQ5_9ACTN|nr:MarR family winged helix-turn-helix transcriptional regulator [Micromonospora endolithica]RKN38229.1 MarR family transcriptional regulator [Micromonospora endolithica]TWJ25223.1 DNA-binding MarR family transcriptional regulator [Micromonospora endolithica]
MRQEASSAAQDSGRPAPRGLAASTALLFIAAGRTVQRRIERDLAAHKLTLRHIGALGHLAANPDLSYSDLARRAGVTAQSMHATVNRLEELGAVQRQLAGHGHPARLEVTDLGHRLLAHAADTAAALDQELLAGLTDQKRDDLARLLHTIAASARP